MGRVVAAMALVILFGTAGARAAGGLRLHVSPPAGNPTTAFTISYVSPTRTGVIGSQRLRDEVSATNPAAASRCDASALQVAPDTRRGRQVRVVLQPAAGERWCSGTFKGKLMELQTPVCPPRSLCPQYERLRVLATFSFAVRPF